MGKDKRRVQISFRKGAKMMDQKLVIDGIVSLGVVGGCAITIIKLFGSNGKLKEAIGEHDKNCLAKLELRELSETVTILATNDKNNEARFKEIKYDIKLLMSHIIKHET